MTRWVLALLGGSIVVVPAALMIWVRTPYALGQYVPVEQPVPFDHRHHVADDGIDCRYCHRLAERSRTAGYPDSEVCMNCHSQIWPASPLLAPVRRSFASDMPIAWRRVHWLPDFVFFDHASHVNAAIGCETCHGRVDRMARVEQVAPLTMQWCVDCHRDPTSALRPRADVTVLGWQPASAHEQRDLARDVRPGTSCSTCHR